jgi:hypothetical protein
MRSLRTLLGVYTLYDRKGNVVWSVDGTGGSSSGNQTVTGLLILSAVDNIAAAGANQAAATALTGEINKVTSGSGGVTLPASLAGLDVYVINQSGSPIQVYGLGADTIDGQVATAGVQQMNGSMCIYSCATAGAWFSNGIGTGYAGQYPTLSYTNGITAHAGGGQGSAVPLTTVINRVTTVGTAGDSVVMPASAPGMQIMVANAAANSMNVFPASGDAINALGANAAYALAAGKTATLYCANAGQWHALLSA